MFQNVRSFILQQHVFVLLLSPSGVEFRNRLQTEFDGVNLPNSMVFDYPTVTDPWDAADGEGVGG